NAFEDALAHERRRLGLPALSVNWGTWAEGMALIDGMEERRQAAGISAMRAEEALHALNLMLLDGPAQAGAGLIDWDRFVRRGPRRQAPKRCLTMLEEERREERSAGPGFLESIMTLPPPARMSALRDQVEALARHVLALPSTRRVDPLQPLNEMGLDSLMAVE